MMLYKAIYFLPLLNFIQKEFIELRYVHLTPQCHKPWQQVGEFVFIYLTSRYARLSHNFCKAA